MKHCQSHCSTCGRHFSSTAAFDLHRTGSFKAGARTCRPPERVKSASDERKLVVVESGGTCEMYRSAEHDVEIWGTA